MGSNFSERIWGKYRPTLVNKLHRELTDCVIRGDNPNNLTEAFAKEFKTSLGAANRLVVSEYSYFNSLSVKDSLNNLGVKKFEVCETLDFTTCERCQEMDGKIFDMEQYEVGVTALPFHPSCRGTACPGFDDEFTQDELRAAWDENGETYYTDCKNYKEWKERFISDNGQQAWNYNEKSAKNFVADDEQFKRYRDVLGENAPKTLEEFQKIKYNDTKKWNTLKHNYRVVNSYENNSGEMDIEKIIELDDFAYNTKTKDFTGKAKTKANIAVMEIDGDIKIANSQVNNINSPYYQNFKGNKKQLVFMKDNPEFKTAIVNSHLRDIDSETKLFEYSADIAKDGKAHTINMLSEKCMCDSCLSVLSQFKEKYPKVKVNVVSNKRERAKKNRNQPWKHRK